MKGERAPVRTVEVPPAFREPLKALYGEVAPPARRLGLKVYLVGGGLRDLVEKKPFSGEWDVVVFGGDGRGAGDLADQVCRGRGEDGPVCFPRFGTCLVYGAPFRIEFSQAQLRSSRTSLSPDPLGADALARDFTLNALYADLTGPSPSRTVSLLDPSGLGLRDLENGRLRTPIPARLTFEDDPLRIFRAARLRACRSYRIDPSIGKAARSLSGRIGDVAAERILEEMNRTLLCERPSLGLEMLGLWGSFLPYMPEIQDMVGFKQNNPFHFPDLFRHTLRVVDRSPPDLALRWAALLHDCGKPATRVFSGEGESYHGHESAGAELAARLLRRLKAGRKLTATVTELIGLHMVHYQDEWSDRAVRRFIHRSGPHLENLLALVEADSASLRRTRSKLRDLEELRKRVGQTLGSMPRPRSPLTGRQIMQILGIGPGEPVGRAKEALIEAVVEGDIPPEEDAAKSFLRKWYGKTYKGPGGTG